MIPPKKCAPCPVCGREPLCWGHTNGKTVMYRMECVGVPEISIRDLLQKDMVVTDGGFHMLATDFFDTEEEAAKQWNKLYGRNVE